MTDRQWVIIWFSADPNLWRYIAPLDHNELTWPCDVVMCTQSSIVLYHYNTFTFRRNTHRWGRVMRRRSEWDSKNVVFNPVLLIGFFRSFHDNALRWMTQDLIDDKSTLVQVMAWCRQATSHYLSQCWLSSLSPYGVANPQWVKFIFSHDDVLHV